MKSLGDADDRGGRSDPQTWGEHRSAPERPGTIPPAGTAGKERLVQQAESPTRACRETQNRVGFSVRPTGTERMTLATPQQLHDEASALDSRPGSPRAAPTRARVNPLRSVRFLAAVIGFGLDAAWQVTWSTIRRAVRRQVPVTVRETRVERLPALGPSGADQQRESGVAVAPT